VEAEAVAAVLVVEEVVVEEDFMAAAAGPALAVAEWVVAEEAEGVLAWAEQVIVQIWEVEAARVGRMLELVEEIRVLVVEGSVQVFQMSIAPALIVPRAV